MTERQAVAATSTANAPAEPSFLPGSEAHREGGHYFAAILDPRGTVTAIDRTGTDAAEWAGVGGGALWEAACWGGQPDIVQRLRAAISAAAEGVSTFLELEMPPGTGCDARVLDLAIRSARDGNGNVTALIVTARDLSARKEAEAELARRNGELQSLYENIRDLDALKMQFFANMNHELRTPLALMLGSSEQLIADGDLPEDTRHSAEVVARNARLLLRHVNDLLDIAKLEARKMRVQYELIDFAGLVRHTAEHFSALARERRITYVIDTPEVLEAELDAAKVERVLLNLLSNAFKFTPSGGSVRVHARVAQAQGGRGGDAVAILSVFDSGPGVTPDQRESIFERFRQGPTSASRFGGTGLGLAIAKDFVELHGGAIAVADAPGGGAAFAIELPLVAERRSADRASTPSEPGIAIDIARQTIDELRESVASLPSSARSSPATPASSAQRHSPPDAPPAEIR